MTSERKATLIIDGQAPVRVAVVRDAHVGARLGHERAQRLEMGGAALHVDVHAVEIIVDDDHLGAQASQGLRRRERGSTVTRIQSDAQALEGNALLLDGEGSFLIAHVKLISLNLPSNAAGKRHARRVSAIVHMI